MSVNKKLADKIGTLHPVESSTQTYTPTITVWDRTSIDFGIVAPGSKQKYSFQYLGPGSLVSVVAGCGCTTTKTEAGEISGFLTIGSDFSFSKEALVNQSKTIKVVTSTDETHILTLSCKVDKTSNVYNSK